MIQVIKWMCLCLLIFNAPTFGLYAFGTGMGSFLNVLTFGMPLLYAILVKNINILKIYLAIGLGYFLVSGIQFYKGVESDYLGKLYKFGLLVLLGGEVVKNTTRNRSKFSSNQCYLFFKLLRPL